MGDKIKAIFEFVKERGGDNAMFRVALKVGILPVYAEKEPDDDKTIKKMWKATRKVLKITKDELFAKPGGDDK